METDRDIPQTMMDGSAHYPPCSDFTLVRFSSAVILLERFRDAIRCRRGGGDKINSINAEQYQTKADYRASAYSSFSVAVRFSGKYSHFSDELHTLSKT